MQMSAKTRRFVPTQVKHVVIALAIVAGVAGASMTAVAIDDDGSTDREPERIVRPVGAEHPMFDYQFMEQNLHLPSAPAPTSPKSTAPDWRVLEQNSWGEDFVLDTPESGSYYPSVDDVPQYDPGQVTY
jgi:hypothetical protein